MNPTTCLTATLLFLSLATVTARTQIVLDFSKKKLSGLPENPRPGDQYDITVTGINLNLYAVSVNSRDSAVSTAALSFPSFATFDLSGLSTLLEGLRSAIAAPPNTNVANGDAGHQLHSENTRPATGHPVIRTDIARRIAEEAEAIAGPKDGFLHRIAIIKDDVEDDYYLMDVEKLRAMAERAEDAAKFSEAGTITAQQVLTRFRCARHDLGVLRADVVHRADEYRAFSHLHNVAAQEEFAAADTLVKTAHLRLLVTIDIALSAVTREKAAACANVLQAFSANASRSYTALPVQFGAGTKILSIAITPLDKQSALQSYTAEYVFPLRRRFYFGVGTSLYLSGLYDEAYSMQPRQGEGDTAVSYWLVDERPQQRETGFATLLKAGAKGKGKMDWLGGHVAFGPGISVGSTVRPRLMGGLGLSAGRTHMLTLDGGLITGRVEQRSRALTMSRGYREAPAESTVSTGATS